MNSTLLRIRAAINILSGGRLFAKAIPYDFSLNLFGPGTTLDDTFEVYAREGMEKNQTVAAAIMFKVRAVSQAPLNAHVNDDDNPSRLPSDHPMQRLMLRANEAMTGVYLQELRTLFYNLCGNSYIYIERDVTGMPTALYPLRPDRVLEVITPPNRIDYAYIPINKTQADGFPILREDMIHDKHPAPLDIYEGYGRGMSPLKAAARSIDIDNKFSRFLSQLVDNGVLPAAMLTSDHILNEKQAKEIQKLYQDRYAGFRNWSDVMVLGQGMRYEKMGMTLEEMVFDKLDARNEARILQALGVSPLLIGTIKGLESSTYTNQEKARQAFWEDVFAFELHGFASNYDLRLNQGGQFRFMHDKSAVPALSGDIAIQADTATKLRRIGVPLNTALKLVGIDVPDIEYGDVPLVDVSMAPVKNLIEGAEDEAAANGAGASAETSARQIPRQALKEMIAWHGRAVSHLPPRAELITEYFESMAHQSMQPVFERFDIPADEPFFLDLCRQLEQIYTAVIRRGQQSRQSESKVAGAIRSIAPYLVGEHPDIFRNDELPWVDERTQNNMQVLANSIQHGIAVKTGQSVMAMDGDVIITDTDVGQAIQSVAADFPLLHDLLNAGVQG